MAGILVVDDESEARRTTRRFLERQGWEVEDAGGEKDAQRLVENREEPYDLLVADVVLAGEENGVVLAEDFYRRGWARKVLFVSAYVDVDLGSVG
ncbi:MAG: response regulator, partial [Longimicrobiales bacterium]|nr:response regulator [Longimicrobiales bacterium]